MCKALSCVLMVMAGIPVQVSATFSPEELYQARKLHATAACTILLADGQTSLQSDFESESSLPEAASVRETLQEEPSPAKAVDPATQSEPWATVSDTYDSEPAEDWSEHRQLAPADASCRNSSPCCSPKSKAQQGVPCHRGCSCESHTELSGLPAGYAESPGKEPFSNRQDTARVMTPADPPTSPVRPVREPSSPTLSSQLDPALQQQFQRPAEQVQCCNAPCSHATVSCWYTQVCL